MKNRINRSKISIILGTGLVAPWSGAAADMGSDSGASSFTTGFYQNADAAVAFIQNMTIRGAAFNGVGLKFHPGPKLALALGYNLTQNFAVEAQTGFAYNGAKFTGSSVPPFAPDVWTAPVTANAIYKYSFNNHWQAYAGAGVGAVFSSLGFNSSGMTADSTDSTFAWHGMAGIKYLFKDRWEAGLGYDFLGSLDHHWSQGEGITTSPTYMHSILLSLTYKF